VLQAEQTAHLLPSLWYRECFMTTYVTSGVQVNQWYLSADDIQATTNMKIGVQVQYSTVISACKYLQYICKVAANNAASVIHRK
jgi:hypothetical protein